MWPLCPSRTAIYLQAKGLGLLRARHRAVRRWVVREAGSDDPIVSFRTSLFALHAHDSRSVASHGHIVLAHSWRNPVIPASAHAQEILDGILGSSILSFHTGTIATISRCRRSFSRSTSIASNST
jgi:hypothetical protein